MDSSIQTFDNQEFGELRVLSIEGEPWFVAKDVCDILGIATNHLREEGRGLDADEVLSLPNWEGKGSAPLIISEPGLYKLVMRSRKPEAKAFQRWVTHEVLPAIRRTGGYMVARHDDTPEEIMARAVLLANDTMERQKERIARLEASNRLMKPKADFYDSAMDAERGYSVTEAARYMHQVDKSMKRKRLFALLQDDGIITKDKQASQLGGTRGYVFNYFPPAITDPNTLEKKQPKPYAKVTQKGLDWMINRYCKKQERMEMEE